MCLPCLVQNFLWLLILAESLIRSGYTLKRKSYWHLRLWLTKTALGEIYTSSMRTITNLNLQTKVQGKSQMFWGYYNVTFWKLTCIGPITLNCSGWYSLVNTSLTKTSQWIFMRAEVEFFICSIQNHSADRLLLCRKNCLKCEAIGRRYYQIIIQCDLFY